MKLKEFSLLAVGLFLGGCVSQGTYEKLQQDYASLGEKDKSEASQIQDLDKKLQDAGVRAQDLEKQLRDAGSKIQEQTVLINDLQSKLGKVTTNKAQLAHSLEEMKQALKDLTARKAMMEDQLKEFHSVAEGLKSLIETGNVKVHFVKGRMVVSLGSDVLFHSGSAHLSKDGKAAVDQVTAQLVTLEGKDFQVEGHTDNVPIHTHDFPSNWELGSARAVAVVSTMVAAGMPAIRVSAASYADTQPAGSNETPEGREQNRRIDIVVIPDLSKLLDVNQLEHATEVAPPAPSGDLPKTSDKK